MSSNLEQSDQLIAINEVRHGQSLIIDHIHNVTDTGELYQSIQSVIRSIEQAFAVKSDYLKQTKRRRNDARNVMRKRAREDLKHRAIEWVTEADLVGMIVKVKSKGNTHYRLVLAQEKDHIRALHLSIKRNRETMKLEFKDAGYITTHSAWNITQIVTDCKYSVKLGMEVLTTVPIRHFLELYKLDNNPQNIPRWTVDFDQIKRDYVNEAVINMAQAGTSS